MILVLDDLDPDNPDVGRFITIHNLAVRYPGQVIRFLSDPHCDLSLMHRDETLYLLAHGSPGSVAHMTPAVVADELLKRGLKVGTRIDTRACHSGVVGPLGTSFVDELADEVKLQSRGKVVVYVSGVTGTGVIQENGAYRAKDPALNTPQQQQVYRQIIAEGRQEIDAAKLFIKQELQKGTSIEAIAAGVARLTRTTFQRLYAHNLTVIKNLEASRTSSSLVEYLQAMDPDWAADGRVLDEIRRREHYEWSTSSPGFRGTPSYIA